MKNFIILISLSVIAFTFQSCATICGGARYNATVKVPDHPMAKITVNGEYKGQGEVHFLYGRRNANELTIVVEEENCEPETTQFKSRVFRGWSFLGTIILDQIEGVIIDAATGAWYKPDVKEPGITKIDYDNYLYTIPYSAKPKKEVTPPLVEPKKETVNAVPKSKADKLRELKQLLDEGILTQEEFEKEKKKILEAEGNN